MIATAGSTPLARLVVVAVLDGLRPDAIDTYQLENLQRLRRQGASTMTAQTVAPSATWAVMTSLLTGVAPATHGINGNFVRLPKSRGKLEPMPSVLRDHGIKATGCLASVPSLYKGVASLVARKVGLDGVRCVGDTAPEIALNARALINQAKHGLVVVHMPDADRAGEEHGWMTPQYEAASRQLDTAAGMLAQICGVPERDDTLLILLADHGGGGAIPNDHVSDHPLDRTIPIILVGGGIPAGTSIDGDVNLLDIPATVLWALGATIPPSYEGRALSDAIRPPAQETATAA